MAAINDFADCLSPGLDLETFKGFELLLDAFLLTIPDLVSLSIVAELPNFPQFPFTLLFSNLSPDFPAFSFQFQGIELTFPGAQLPSLNGLPAFSVGTPDAGMLKFLLGLGGIMVNLPSLFIDLDADPPLLKIPTYDILLEFITLQLGLQAEINVLDADFAIKFAGCLTKAIAKVLL